MLALDVDELSRERLGFLAHLQRRKRARFLHHLVFDGKSVTIPAGDVRRPFAQHGLRFHHEIFEDLVERGAHVHIAVGKGRTVMQNKQLSTLPRLLDLLVKPCFLPNPEQLRLARGKVRLHRKLRARQVQSIFVVLAHGGRAIAT